MRKNKKLSDIISDNNLCISNNPYGMTRSWPNSFVQKFYNKLCNDIYVCLKYYSVRPSAKVSVMKFA